MLAIAKDIVFRVTGAGVFACGSIGALALGGFESDPIGQAGLFASLCLMILGAAMALMGATESRA